MATIRCRSRVAPSCYNGQVKTKLYNEDSPYGSYDSDGTYDPRDGTIICDPCYIALGMPLRGSKAFRTGQRE